MKLYHFTAEHLVDHILKQGITRGVFPVLDENGRLQFLINPCQWLMTQIGTHRAGLQEKKSDTTGRL